jgi:NAD(P)-dependent dehydrogenase (short-subunit alcohol dehydrogenase family)
MTPHHILVGGTKGAGRALARLLLSQGHNVSVLGRTRPSGLEGDGLRFVEADLERPDEAAGRLLEAIPGLGPIHGLVFLQRYRGKGDDWEGEITVELTATRKIVDVCIEHFAPAPLAAIVMVGSNAGKFIQNGGPASYHVAKAGIVQLARWFAMKLGPQGIRANAVSPCTFLKDESKNFYLENKKLLNLYEQIVPLRRMGTAEDVAQAIEFLISPKASFITGQELFVDGGLSLHLHDSMARMVAEM